MSERFPVFLAVFLLLSSLVYNLECAFPLNFGPNRGYVLLGAFLATFWIVRILYRRRTIQEAGHVSPRVMVAAFILVCIYNLWTHIPLLSTDNDELFRLSFARAIVHSGMPVTYDWFVAGDSQRFVYYVLLEYITAGIHQLSGNHISLEFLYLELLPWFMRLSILMLTFELTARVTGLQNSGKYTKINTLYLGLAVLILQFGPSLFSGAVAISLNRQAWFACVLLLLASVFVLRDLQDNRSDRSPGIFIWLAWSVAVILANIKLPLVPVLVCGLLGYEGARILFQRKVAITRIVPILTGLGLLGVVYKINPVTARTQMHWMVQFFYLVERNGVGWMFPGLDSKWLAGLLAFGAPAIPLVVYGWMVARKKTNARALAIAATFLAAMTLAGLVAGLILRPSVETGGAEVYWLLAGWYSLGILVVWSLPLILSQKPYFAALLVLPGFILTTASGYSMWAITRQDSEIAATVAEIKATCDFIDTRLPKTPTASTALAQPWKGLSQYYVNAFCPFPTIITDHHYGDMANHALFESSLSFNQAVVEGSIDKQRLEAGLKQRGLQNLLIIAAKKIPAMNEIYQAPGVEVGRMTIYHFTCKTC